MAANQDSHTDLMIFFFLLLGQQLYQEILVANHAQAEYS